MDNQSPFTKLINFMREEGSANNPPSILLAEVTSVQSLTVKAGELPIDGDNLYIADYLLAGYKRKYIDRGTQKLQSGFAGNITMRNKNKDDQPPYQYTTTPFVESMNLIDIESEDVGEVEWTDTLEVGDLLAVMPTYDQQNYIVLCRVVKL